ncbi:E3 ubiquitin-protein ligase MARCHF11-like [Hemiscyllium ocellatum]|uniref:E3 ubiquitin-protein ligase MARCHF11-like n=1 Tax=Hemiscyllium ocellatum TaxID=170820 RepID=UPI002965D6FB|nr:E3 ubiquitin-protein ligase MARCHF11-like [Hemiscyllium ocellatum]
MSEHQPLPQRDQRQRQSGMASNGSTVPGGGALGHQSPPTPTTAAAAARQRGQGLGAGERQKLIPARAEEARGCAPPAAQDGRPAEHESYQTGGLSCSNDAESVCSSSSSCSFRNGGITPTCRICFQGSEQGELLSPCRCDGSVRYSHQPCLLKWISERGSWSCEICCYRYHVVAIRMKRPCQWEPITVTLVEKVQIIAVILGCLFLIASVTWLLWSAFSPAAIWQRRDVLFQICYGMYGFMDLVCIGLIVHEGAAIYRVFKRWRAVNLHWTVLNYDKSKDLEINSSNAESSTNQNFWASLNQFRTQRPVGSTQLMLEGFHCSYTLLHLLTRFRPNDEDYDDNSSAEVVMRVTTV